MLASKVSRWNGCVLLLVAEQHPVAIKELGQAVAQGHLIGRGRQVSAGHQLQQSHAKLELLVADRLRRIIDGERD